MNSLLLAILIPLHFTAPGDTVGVGAGALVYLPAPPVHAYVFHQLDSNGTLTATPGYADSAGSAILTPHAPGMRETVWFMPGADGNPVTIYMMSLDASGNLSAPSNGCVIGERSMPAQLAALLADYDAAVAALTRDPLIPLLISGVRPFVPYAYGSGPATVEQSGVVTGGDAAEVSFTLHGGTSRRRVARRDELVKWWEPAVSQALIVRQRVPKSTLRGVPAAGE